MEKLIYESQHLVFDNILKKYFWVSQGDKLTCKVCKKDIEDTFIHTLSWFKRDVMIGHYCQKCYSKIKTLGIIDEYKIVFLTNELKKSFIPLVLEPPKLRNARDMSVFEAVSQTNCPSDEVIDNTKLANRESWEGSRIGADVSHVLEAKDKVLHGVEGLDYLDSLVKEKEESPVIIKRIGDKLRIYHVQPKELEGEKNGV